MPLDLFYTMVQKVKNDQKLKSKGGGGVLALTFLSLGLSLWNLAHLFIIQEVLQQVSGRLLSCNCGGLLWAGSWSWRSGRPSADSGPSEAPFFFWPEFFQAAPTHCTAGETVYTFQRTKLVRLAIDVFQRMITTVAVFVLVSRQCSP